MLYMQACAPFVQWPFFGNHSSRIIESWARLPKPPKEETRKGYIQTNPKIEKIQLEEILSRMKGHNRPEFSQKNRKWNYPVFGKSTLFATKRKEPKSKTKTHSAYQPTNQNGKYDNPKQIPPIEANVRVSQEAMASSKRSIQGIRGFKHRTWGFVYVFGQDTTTKNCFQSQRLFSQQRIYELFGRTF